MQTVTNDLQCRRQVPAETHAPGRVRVPGRLAALLATGLAALLATALGAAVAALLVEVLADGRGGAPGTGPSTPEDLLTSVAALMALALLGWLAMGALLEVAARAPGRVGADAARLAARVTPSVTRRAVGFVLGVGLAAVAAPPPAGAWGRVAAPAARVAGAAPAGVKTPASSAPGPGRRPSLGPAPAPDPGFAATAPAPGWTPAAPVVRPQPSTDLLSRPPRTAVSDDEVVVHRGDTLWSIAARHLGAGASDAEVAAAWPRWHVANRHVVGPDPDRILPGQRLRAPAAGPAA